MSHVRFMCTACGAPNECLSKDIWDADDGDCFHTTHAKCASCQGIMTWTAYGLDDLAKKHIVFRYTPIAPLSFATPAPGV